MIEFKKGDVVELKSGGGSMTVKDVTQRDGRTTVHCTWMNGQKDIRNETFEAEVLKLHQNVIKEGLTSLGLGRNKGSPERGTPS
jgi:uncharacterized protein YodC (DUF2158 family)